MTPHVCRHCDGLITDEADGVPVAYEPSNSGPGWEVRAHREHAHMVRPDPVAVVLLARIRVLRAARSGI
ncbi:hypothetical protein OG747_30650 [Streptomyces sp. NBC_01384]|uniref:hypothetical protein n=1 Tax=Streptomyces sp. NBC_01384 TaxID=2903847 RepID=UPI0032518548